MGTILPSAPPQGLHCRFLSGVLHQPTLQVGARKGPAEAVQSIIFDRTGQEKGQAPGWQINLMKFIIGCGNISLVIKAGLSHKKLLIKPLPLSPLHISSFTVGRNILIVPSPLRCKGNFSFLDFGVFLGVKYLLPSLSDAWVPTVQLCPLQAEEVPYAECLLPRQSPWQAMMSLLS